MKNIRTTIEQELDKLDNKWQALPLRTQVRYVIILFACYLIIGIGVLVKVCYDLGKENNNISIKHIEAPPLMQDASVSNETEINRNKNQENGRERE
ncbi:nitrogen regulatory IIA protein [Chryseobacterium pennae]|uniref:Nitrogen regulatory IIA protein n=1 Tax=Chryseobacterium pennae TaxID=2258962 RepID=A0A3D9C808_9FLAO|nr:nitrogen regulatory IIA protein [Chryseobacterium pennae]REC61838.1 nitrogen regulatory IIA protein [Chryseobacterium pennae]